MVPLESPRSPSQSRKSARLATSPLARSTRARAHVLGLIAHALLPDLDGRIGIDWLEVGRGIALGLPSEVEALRLRPYRLGAVVHRLGAVVPVVHRPKLED